MSETDKLLVKAIERRSDDDVAKALAGGASPDIFIDGYPLLCIAVAQRNVPLVAALLKANAAPDINDFHQKTPLIYAAMAGGSSEMIEIVEMLLKAGAHPNKSDYIGRRPVDWAARFLNPAVGLMVINAGGTPGDTYAKPWVERIKASANDRSKSR